MMDKYLLEKREIINNNLEKYLIKNASNNEFDNMLKYSLLLGGKRIRPIIMYILADIYKKDYSMIEKEAISIELMHTYSLIHDDLPSMDNDDYRRGNLTSHKKFGEANAILIGDALLTMSFLALSESKYSNMKSVQTLAYYSGNKGMILGQYLDLFFEKKEINYDDLLEITINKTTMLLMASVELASISLKIDIEARNILRKYIFYLGMAYQIQDDILELEQDEKKLGKSKSDLKNEKSTFPRVLGLNESKKLLNVFTNTAIDLVKDNEILVRFANYLLKREY